MKINFIPSNDNDTNAVHAMEILKFLKALYCVVIIIKRSTEATTVEPYITHTNALSRDYETFITANDQHFRLLFIIMYSLLFVNYILCDKHGNMNARLLT